MNIALFPSECKISETIFCPLSLEEFNTLVAAGLIAKKLRSYRLVFLHREIQVECPVLLEGKRPVGVLFPAFKLPYRPYPCFIYLFAVALCLAGFSMRKAAKQTGKKFGLPRFSHSTVSRVFSVLAANASLLADLCGEDYDEPADQTVSSPDSGALPGRPALLISPRWPEAHKQAAPLLFKALASLLPDPESGILLVYQYFMKYCCLLL